jgi:hypothetical protein
MGNVYPPRLSYVLRIRDLSISTISRHSVEYRKSLEFRPACCVACIYRADTSWPLAGADGTFLSHIELESFSLSILCTKSMHTVLAIFATSSSRKILNPILIHIITLCRIFWVLIRIDGNEAYRAKSNVKVYSEGLVRPQPLLEHILFPWLVSAAGGVGVEGINQAVELMEGVEIHFVVP